MRTFQLAVVLVGMSIVVGCSDRKPNDILIGTWGFPPEDISQDASLSEVTTRFTADGFCFDSRESGGAPYTVDTVGTNLVVRLKTILGAFEVPLVIRNNRRILFGFHELVKRD
jgi:hypothetical protein